MVLLNYASISVLVSQYSHPTPTTITWHRSGSQTLDPGCMLSIDCRRGRQSELARASKTAFGSVRSVGTTSRRSRGRLTGVRAIEMKASWLSWLHSPQSKVSTVSSTCTETTYNKIKLIAVGITISQVCKVTSVQMSRPSMTTLTSTVHEIYHDSLQLKVRHIYRSHFELTDTVLTSIMHESTVHY